MTCSRRFALALALCPLAACGGESDGGGTRTGITYDMAGTSSPNSPDGSTMPTSGPKRVFVTSTAYTASFGGVTKGDQLCNASAVAAGLDGNWVAWLSDGNTSAADRIAGTGPWSLLDGTPVFATAAQLRTAPSVPIDHDETGAHVTPSKSQVWTGTSTGGFSSVDNCVLWLETGTTGTVGDAYSTTGWTDNGTLDCSGLASLYCFEQ